MSEIYPYAFTVFTPTYNRAHTLSRVYSSLKRQTYSDFEWIVIDDGSSDGTNKLVSTWINEAPFIIRYYHQDNAGKHAAINRAAQLAEGYFFLIADSDDSFEPDTLEKFYYYWNTLSPQHKQICAGVACLAKNGYTDQLIGSKHTVSTPSLVYELPYNFKFKRNFEGWGVLRSDILLKHPFPEINSIKFIPEGIVWNTICRGYPRVITNEVLRTIYHQDDGFSINTRFNYYHHAKGFYIYYLYNLLNNSDLMTKHNPIHLVKEIVQLNRVAVHSNIGSITTWKRVFLKPVIASLFWPSFCIGSILALLDRLRLKNHK